jgi:hypothetical protein
VDRLYEGDPAPAQAFEELVSIWSEDAIGPTGAQRLVPWLRTNNSPGNNSSSGYVVILCDPRPKSPEFRETVKFWRRDLPRDLLSRVVLVNADTPAENRRWLKKSVGDMMHHGDTTTEPPSSSSSPPSISVYSDEKMQWMRTYTALGETRWSMTLFVLADGRIQKLVRELSSVTATKVVQNAVKAAEQRRL